MTLDEYFHSLYEEPSIDGYPMWSGLPINKQEKQTMSTVWKQDEEALTTIYFSIRSPAVEQYPANEHTASIEWQEGATWHQIVWEVLKVIEAQYGYGIKNKVFFNVHGLVREAEETHGDPDLAKQMFEKELS